MDRPLPGGAAVRQRHAVDHPPGHRICLFIREFIKRRENRHPPPPRDIPSGCCSFTGPGQSLRMLRRVAAFCRPLRLVLLLVLFPCSRSPVVGVLGLC